MTRTTNHEGAVAGRWDTELRQTPIRIDHLNERGQIDDTGLGTPGHGRKFQQGDVP